jgi:hypothetical protein
VYPKLVTDVTVPRPLRRSTSVSHGPPLEPPVIVQAMPWSVVGVNEGSALRSCRSGPEQPISVSPSQGASAG